MKDVTIYSEMAQYLHAQPLARERKNKDRAIVNLMLKHHTQLRDAVASGVVTKDNLIEFVHDNNSYDRAWRKVTEEVPALRGNDYHMKDILVTTKQRELGYSV